MITFWAIYARNDPYQRLVMVWLVILILLLLGGIALYFGYTAAPEHAAKAGQLRVYGWWLVGIGFVVYLFKRLLCWWIRR